MKRQSKPQRRPRIFKRVLTQLLIEAGIAFAILMLIRRREQHPKPV